jgi:hypothetical protein
MNTDIAIEEDQLVRAGKQIIAHIRTNKNLYETNPIIEIAKEIEGALFERTEIADEKSRDYEADGEV